MISIVGTNKLNEIACTSATKRKWEFLSNALFLLFMFRIMMNKEETVIAHCFYWTKYKFMLTDAYLNDKGAISAT